MDNTPGENEIIQVVEPEVINPEEILRENYAYGGQNFKLHSPSLKQKFSLALFLFCIGLAVIAAGAALTLTIIGAFVGIPLILLGLLVIFFSIKLPFTLNKSFSYFTWKSRP